MVDTSSMYNLSNPALNDDIGLNCLNKSLPITPNGFDGEPYVPDMAGVKLQDQVSKDTFDKSSDKTQDKDKDNNDKKMQHLLINSQNLQQLKSTDWWRYCNN